MESGSSSSVAAAPFQDSFLQVTLTRLSSTHSLKVPAEDASPVAVIALQRYLTLPTENQQLDSYDATVTDGVWRAKCFLHPTLNPLVQKNSLRTGMDISITQCSYVYDERKLGHGYICLEHLRLGSGKSSVLSRIKDVNSLPLLVKHGMERSLVLLSDVPLQASQKHYLPLWNNDDPEGDIWAPECPPTEPVLDVSKVILLSSLESCFRVSWKPLPLLVKILHKSRLRFYGKFGLKIDYPYHAYFEVADQSGIMSLVLWNELCPEFYQRMNVGTVLYLQNYTLKQSYSNRSHPQMDHHRMKTFKCVEICLNPRNPASVITIVPPKSVLPQWGLPEVSYQFTTRSQMETLANNSACDVIGLVLFVGRVERVKSKPNKVPEKYWTYRWVHALDGTSEQPFILELFSSSQPEIFNQISPMTYLVCSQMRVCKVEGSMSYLTSSCETEIFITGCHKGRPYVNDPSVKSFIRWTKTLKDNEILQKTSIGGYYCYPHPPKVFTQSAVEAPGQVPLVAAADLKKELENLQHREHKKLAIQGQITAVRYMEGAMATKEQASETVVAHNEQTVADGLKSPSHCVSKRRITTEYELFPHSEVPDSFLNQSSALTKRPKRTSLEDVLCEELSHTCSRLAWESSSWSKQRAELSEYLRLGGLHQDSISRSFTFDEKKALLQWSNLQASRWTPESTAETIPAVHSPGYYQLTILGINKQLAVDAVFCPIANLSDPRVLGLRQCHHDNSMLSCLSSGFLSPLAKTTLPTPEEIVATAHELEDTHVVCVLDLCHLGEEKVEIMINKVYPLSEVSLD